MCRHRYSASLNSDIPKVVTDIPKEIKMKSKALLIMKEKRKER